MWHVIQIDGETSIAAEGSVTYHAAKAIGIEQCSLYSGDYDACVKFCRDHNIPVWMHPLA